VETTAEAWLEMLRKELLAPADAILQLSTMLSDDLARTDAAKSFQTDLDRIRQASREFVDLAHEVLGSSDLKLPASRIRHDLLSPLAQIIGYCELLLEDLPETWSGRITADLKQIRHAAEKLRASIDDILHFRQLAARNRHSDGGVLIVEERIDEVVRTLARSRQSPSSIRQQGRVLAADDNEFNRHIIQRWLQRLGHSVRTASDGEEVLRCLAEERFDVILLDIIMPGMNGVQVLARLKENPEWRHIPTIMITSLHEMEAVALCIELGAEDYLTKPFQAALLEARIGTCLEKKRLRDREAMHLRQIEEEKARYNGLLRAILPDPIVNELQRTGNVQPQRHEQVAVLFADIVHFTDYCEKNPPERVLNYLQDLIQAFEKIAQRYGVQKTKTIGDSFMAAAGLLTTVANPVRSCVQSGLEMIDAARILPPHWSLRVGVHSGSVVAGLLGRQQYLFDLWGATVNLAARVEGNGREGAVTLSEAAYAQIAPFSRTEPLGVVDLKGIGRVKLFRFVQFLS